MRGPKYSRFIHQVSSPYLKPKQNKKDTLAYFLKKQFLFAFFLNSILLNMMTKND